MRITLACSLLLLWATSASAQGGITPQAPGPTVQAPAQPSPDQLLLLDVSVLTRAGSVTGLSKDAFTVLDNKAPQEIVYFSQEDEPLSVAMLFDVSASMNGDSRLKTIKEQFSQFIRASNPSNEYFVISFSDQVKLLAGGVRGDEAIATATGLLSTTKLARKTLFYDACRVGVETVMRGRHRKKVVLAFSDRMDNGSRYDIGHVRRLLKETPVLFLAVTFRGPLPDDSYYYKDQRELNELSNLTGGWAYDLYEVKEFIAWLNIVATFLRHQYTLGFRPDKSTADGKWHKLKVEVRLPPGVPIKQKEIGVVTREGYYARQ